MKTGRTLFMVTLLDGFYFGTFDDRCTRAKVLLAQTHKMGFPYLWVGKSLLHDILIIKFSATTYHYFRLLPLIIRTMNSVLQLVNDWLSHLSTHHILFGRKKCDVVAPNISCLPYCNLKFVTYFYYQSRTFGIHLVSILYGFWHISRRKNDWESYNNLKSLWLTCLNSTINVWCHWSYIR